MHYTYTDAETGKPFPASGPKVEFDKPRSFGVIDDPPLKEKEDMMPTFQTIDTINGIEFRGPVIEAQSIIEAQILASELDVCGTVTVTENREERHV